MKTEAEIRAFAKDVELCCKYFLSASGMEATIETALILMTLEWVLGSANEDVLANVEAIQSKACELRKRAQAARR
jgi:hypothetical protein